MSIETTTIPITPRSIVNCLDLAMLMLRRSFGVYIQVWSIVTLPLAAVVYFSAYQWQVNILYSAILAFIATGPLGLMVAAVTVPSTFGQPQSLNSGLQFLGPRWPLIILGSVLWRIVHALGLVACVLPGVYLMTRQCFSAEQRILTAMPGRLTTPRANKLVDRRADDRTGTVLTLMLHGAALWAALVVTADFAATHLLGVPVLLGRLSVDSQYLNNFSEMFVAMMKFLWSDPLVETTVIVIAMFVYLYLRVTWFLYYVDIRVRQDCWDIELQIKQEVARLQKLS